MTNGLDLSPAGQGPAEERAQRRRVAFSGAIGSMLEYFDFVLFGLIAPSVFDRLFFPPGHGEAARISVLIIYAVGYVARPLGGVVFGHFGDRIGRKPILFVSLTLMGVATTLLGLIPTYQSIGMLAPVLLILLRAAQGFAIGGEITAGTVLATEMGPAGGRGRFTSFIQIGGAMGSVLASLAGSLVSHLPEDEMLSWGWRVPFVMSFALVAIGLYVRRNLHESPVFVAAMERAPPARLPLAAVFRDARGPMLIICLCMLTQSNMLQIFTVFGLVYGVEHAGAARVDIMNGMLIGNLVGCCLMAVYGHLSDRIGRRPLVIASMLLSVIYADLVFFPGLSSGNGWIVMFCVAGASAFIQPMIFGVSASYLAELIPDPRQRFTGVGFGASLGSLLSGFFPAIAQILYQSTGTLYGPIGYYGLFAAISIFAVWKGRETRSVSLLNAGAGPSS